MSHAPEQQQEHPAPEATASRRPAFFRRQLVVDPGLQYGLSARVAGASLLTIAAMVLALLWPLIRQLGISNPQLDADLATVLLYMHERIWIIAGVCVVVVAVGAILTSHRIAGPMVRVKRNLRMLGEGRLPSRLVPRDRDYLKDVVDALNAAVRGLGGLVDDGRRAAADVDAAVRSLRERVALTGDQATTTAMAEVEAAVAALQAAMGRFVQLGDTGGAAPPAPSPPPVARTEEPAEC